MTRGKLIVIEGGDGAGKKTQTALLTERLRAAGKRVESISFPQYGEVSASFVERYLRGELGPKEAISPYVASMFYAHDRFVVAPKIEAWLAEGAWVLSDRYVQSNMAHQGARVPSPAARTSLLAWLDDLEFVRLGIPRPDLTLVLAVPAVTRDANVEKKEARAYLQGAAKDIHEGDLPYQERVEAVYHELARTLPAHLWVDCTENGTLLPANRCHDLVWEHVRNIA
jgi:dTMP kinase